MSPFPARGLLIDSDFQRCRGQNGINVADHRQAGEDRVLAGRFMSNSSASGINCSIVSFGFKSLVSIAEPP